jgi:RNA polymerase sigma-70 factor (ECF subfamily)
MEPETPILEPVDGCTAAVTARADVLVVAAWTDHHGELYAFLVRTTRDPAAAEDLLAETYLRLTRELRAGRSLDNPRAWLYRVAANLAVSRGRRLRTAARALVAVAGRATGPDPDDPPEAGIVAAETRAELLAALDGLGPDARTTLLLAGEGFSGPEIAAAIGRSEAATRTLLCRARVTVRARLRERAEVSP